jgi:hypothetical protein
MVMMTSRAETDSDGPQEPLKDGEAFPGNIAAILIKSGEKLKKC